MMKRDELEADPAERFADDQRNAVAQRVRNDLPVDRHKGGSHRGTCGSTISAAISCAAAYPAAATPPDWPNT